ncbi:isochorismatase family protein [Rhizodiscina lignyota]|uniref:Isochorismatase family protein n=1 Tax=Rhizodiscina lignyota TaxID=1504668 RepID=A0A9P4MAV7_9PEZI|nr:isochorismatase family protein [Rhizodiscina lignyota]
MAEPHRRAIIGNASNFWLHSSRDGFDLTHPPTPSETAPGPKLKIQTTTAPITVSPARSALVIIDMQNFFLSEALGRGKGAGHAACDALMKYAIPAARKAGMQIIWLNWGLTDEEVRDMPPAVKRAFGFQANVVADGESITNGAADPYAESETSIGVDKHGDPKHQGGNVMLENGKDGRIYKGLGCQCGSVTLPSGEKIDAGRLLMRDTWNAALYPPLDKAYEEGLKAKVPDVWIHKNRMSGMWGASQMCDEFIEKQGIRTLFFTGVNTDQCVAGTLTDAFSKGYDIVLLNDGAGTTSPNFSQECIEFNAGKTWGFSTDCKSLFEAAEAMKA